MFSTWGFFSIRCKKRITIRSAWAVHVYQLSSPDRNTLKKKKEKKGKGFCDFVLQCRFCSRYYSPRIQTHAAFKKLPTGSWTAALSDV